MDNNEEDFTIIESESSEFSETQLQKVTREKETLENAHRIALTQLKSDQEKLQQAEQEITALKEDLARLNLELEAQKELHSREVAEILEQGRLGDQQKEEEKRASELALAMLNEEVKKLKEKDGENERELERERHKSKAKQEAHQNHGPQTPEELVAILKAFMQGFHRFSDLEKQDSIRRLTPFIKDLQGILNLISWSNGASTTAPTTTTTFSSVTPALSNNNNNNLANSMTFQLDSVLVPISLTNYEEEFRPVMQGADAIREGIRRVKSEGFEIIYPTKEDNFSVVRALALGYFLSPHAVLPQMIPPETFLKQEAWFSSWGEGDFPNNIERLGMALNTFKEAVKRFNGIQNLNERGSKLREFFNGPAEAQILDAMKYFMLCEATASHESLQTEDMPEWVMMLFCRDHCETPEGLMRSYLNKLGKNARMEPVDVWLVAKVLGAVVRIYHLGKPKAHDFLSEYVGNHQDDAPLLCLTTTDERLFNVIVKKL